MNTTCFYPVCRFENRVLHSWGIFVSKAGTGISRRDWCFTSGILIPPIFRIQPFFRLLAFSSGRKITRLKNACFIPSDVNNYYMPLSSRKISKLLIWKVAILSNIRVVTSIFPVVSKRHFFLLPKYEILFN